MRLMRKMEKIKLWLALLLWAGVIFGFSSLPINKETEFSWIDFIIKKTAHVVEYGILFWLLVRAWTNKSFEIKPKMVIYAFIICILYALSDEWHQTFVPGREGTLRDVGFDTIGVFLSFNQIKRSL